VIVPTYNSGSLANFSMLRWSVTITIPLNEDITIPKANQQEIARVGATGRFKVSTPCVKNKSWYLQYDGRILSSGRYPSFDYGLQVGNLLSCEPGTKWNKKRIRDVGDTNHQYARYPESWETQVWETVTMLPWHYGRGGAIESSSTLRGHRGPSAATRV